MNLNQRTNQELEHTRQHAGKETTVLEFQSAEELLRHDAATVELPVGIAERLAESAEATRPVPWWKRWIQ